MRKGNLTSSGISDISYGYDSVMSNYNQKLHMSDNSFDFSLLHEKKKSVNPDEHEHLGYINDDRISMDLAMFSNTSSSMASDRNSLHDNKRSVAKSDVYESTLGWKYPNLNHPINENEDSDDESYREDYASYQASILAGDKFRRTTHLHRACKKIKSKVSKLHELLNKYPGDASAIDSEGNLPLHLISLNESLLLGQWAKETRIFINELIDAYPGKDTRF